jgi:hypothetical protein
MSIKRKKFMSVITAHPKLVTIAVGFAFTVAVGTALGLVVNGQEEAFALQMSSNDER